MSKIATAIMLILLFWCIGPGEASLGHAESVMGGAGCPNRKVPGVCPNTTVSTGCETKPADTSKFWECWYTMDFDPLPDGNCDGVAAPGPIAGLKCDSKAKFKHKPGCSVQIACWWG